MSVAGGVHLMSAAPFSTLARPAGGLYGAPNSSQRGLDSGIPTLGRNALGMSKLKLSVAIGDYDRNRPLIDGAVQIDGVDPVFMTLSPEEIFFRAFRTQDFDICELSLSSFTVKTAQGDCPYVGIPAFLSRAFRHTSIYVRTDRVKKPEDLKGRKVGVPEYQLTANVWARAILEDDFGVTPADVHWIRGGIEQADRPEKITIKLPSGVKLDNAPDGATISELLIKGEIDGFIAPRPPSHVDGHPNIGWLFPDPVAAAKDYFKRTGIFPIMHLLGLRRTLADAHPWLPAALMKAFENSKAAALAKLSDTSATKVTLPFIEEQLKATRALMGEDYWAYGLAANRRTLDAFLRRHHAEGLSHRLLAAEELFHPATHESFRL
jgi:4,5-dihydroxyphthalate decarboxylase